MKRFFLFLLSVSLITNSTWSQSLDCFLADPFPPPTPAPPLPSLQFGCIPTSPDYFNYYVAKENYIPFTTATPFICYKTIKINVIVMGSSVYPTYNFQPSEQS